MSEIYDVKRGFKTAKIIFLYMFMTNLLYLGVIYYVDSNNYFGEVTISKIALELVMYAGYIYNIAMMLVSPIIKKMLLNNKSIYIKKSKNENIPAFVANYTTRQFIIYAIIEAGTIISFAYYLMSQDLYNTIFMIAFSSVSLLLTAPKLKELEELEANLEENLH